MIDWSRAQGQALQRRRQAEYEAEQERKERTLTPEERALALALLDDLYPSRRRLVSKSGDCSRLKSG